MGTVGFWVDTTALSGLPRLLDRLHDDARAARIYLVKYTDLAGGEGLLNLVLGSHRRVVGTVGDFFGTVEGRLAGPLSTRVRLAINYYRQTDVTAATAFDATTPATAASGPSTMVGAGPASFADRTEPQSALAPPPDHAGTFHLERLFPPLLSPAGAGREVIWRVTGVAASLGIGDRPIDPYIEFVRPFVGDWAGLRGCADAFTALAAAADGMATNVHGAVTGIQVSWHGNSADAAREVLVRTGRGLSGAGGPLRVLAERYKAVAEKTHEIAGKIAGLLVEAVDYAVQAVLSVGLAGVTGKTVVGGVVFSALAIDRVVRCVETLHRIALLVKTATEIVMLGMKAAEGFNLIDSRVRLPALPAAAPALPSAGGPRPR